MLHATQVMLETDIVAQVDAKVTERQRSDWVRGAMRLRLVLEDAIENDDAITDEMIRQALGIIESVVIA